MARTGISNFKISNNGFGQFLSLTEKGDPERIIAFTLLSKSISLLNGWISE